MTPPSFGNNEALVDEDGIFQSLPTMTKKEIENSCSANGGYSTPKLNDTLYLHHKGYQRIENLEEFTGLKSLWLHSNGLGKIENINHLHELRCLFLQRNALTTIEGLDGLNSLVQLDLSENNIRHVEGLSHLPNLTTLNLSKNALQDAESISHLKECENLSALDLSKNHLAGSDIIDCLAGIQKVTSLNMEGNPVVSKVAYFRKKVICACKTLRYLDRPIDDIERAAAQAWDKGGIDLERETKTKLLQAKREMNKQTMQEFRDWQASLRREDAGDNFVPRFEVDNTAPPELAIGSSCCSGEAFLTSNEYDELGEQPFIEILDEPVCKEEKPIKDQTQPILEKEDPISSQINKKVVVTLGTNNVVEVRRVKEVPKKEEVVVAKAEEVDLEKENVTPPHNPTPTTTPEDTTRQKEADTIEESARRIRDSLAIMKSNGQQHTNKMSSNITMGWTQEMEKKLMSLASEFGYDFDKVASSLSEDHGSKHITFDSESCFRRWSLLDLSNVEENITKEEEFVCPQTDKALSYFTTFKGRKTMEELQSPSMVVHPDFSTYEEELLSPSGDVVMHRDDWVDEFKSKSHAH